MQLPEASIARELNCISASRSADIGQFIAPNGNDITNDSSVTIGDGSDPGHVSIQLQSGGEEGVYSCVIPDENDVEQYLHVGIYYGAFNSKWSVDQASDFTHSFCCT